MPRVNCLKRNRFARGTISFIRFIQQIGEHDESINVLGQFGYNCVAGQWVFARNGRGWVGQASDLFQSGYTYPAESLPELPPAQPDWALLAARLRAREGLGRDDQRGGK